MRKLVKLRGVLLVLFVLPTPCLGKAAAQVAPVQSSQPDQLLKAAGQKIQSMLVNFQPTDADWFAPSFFESVPADKLADLLKAQHQLMGTIERVRLCRLIDPHSGELEFISKQGHRMRAAIRLEPQSPHRCFYLVFSRVDTGTDTWNSLKEDLKKLPGTQGASVWELAPTTAKLFGYQETTPLAIGSSFKLLVTLELCDQISAGKRQWADTTTLTEQGRSLPAGLLQDWPLGSPITLHTLAAMMTSRSDNTAADHLMLTLGRDALEAQLKKVPTFQPERNRPFLRTSELFKIKLIAPESLAASYPKLSEAEKRQTLQQLDAMPLRNPRLYTMPTHIDQVEWFFTTDDLCQVLDKLRQSKEQQRALELLAITRPFDIDDHAWDYLASKVGQRRASSISHSSANCEAKTAGMPSRSPGTAPMPLSMKQPGYA
jgi:hypothetical protein